MSFLNFIFPSYLSNADKKVQLQHEYEELHKELIKTEEACHEVQEAIQHLEEDNMQFMLSILETRKQ